MGDLPKGVLEVSWVPLTMRTEKKLNFLVSERHFPGAKPGPFAETEGSRASDD